MLRALTSTTFRRLSPILSAIGMPWGSNVPEQLVFFACWLADCPIATGDPAIALGAVAKPSKDRHLCQEASQYRPMSRVPGKTTQQDKHHTEFNRARGNVWEASE